MMTKFIAGVLTVIAAGVLLIAYGLLNPRQASPGWEATYARPMLAGDRVILREEPYGVRDGYAERLVRITSEPEPDVTYSRFVQAAPVRTASIAPMPRTVTRVVERSPRNDGKRNWKKTAAVIGGSSAAGAGIGAIFGGKKGALIGAAVGGGASTIFEATK